MALKLVSYTYLYICVWLLYYFTPQQSVGSEIKPQTKDQGYANVLLGQSYHKPHGAVIDENGEMMQ